MNEDMLREYLHRYENDLDFQREQDADPTSGPDFDLYRIISGLQTIRFESMLDHFEDLEIQVRLDEIIPERWNLYEQYREGSLRQNQKEDFEEKLHSYPQLKLEYDQYTQAQALLEDAGKSEMMQSFESIERSEFKDTATITKRLPLRRVLAAAATVLILVTTGVWLFQDREPFDVASQLTEVQMDQYRSEQNQQLPNFLMATDSELNQFLNDTSDEWNRSIKNLLVADVYFKRGAYEKAKALYSLVLEEDDIRYSNTARWNHVLSLYLSDNRDEAISILEDIAMDEWDPLRPKAIELIKRLPETH